MGPGCAVPTVIDVFFILYAIGFCGNGPEDDVAVCQFSEPLKWCKEIGFGCELTPDRIELVSDPEHLCEPTNGPQRGGVQDLPLGAPILISIMVSPQRFAFIDLNPGVYCARATDMRDPDVIDQFSLFVIRGPLESLP